MKKGILIAVLSMTSVSLFAQVKLTKENIQKDSTIEAAIIEPAVEDAQGEAPDWASLTAEIIRKYDAVYADRNITKNQIYFYYNKDWPAFTGALIKYTEKYEPKDNAKLLNKNAAMILKFSDDKKELQSALNWSKLSLAAAPRNADYKKTYDDLNAKINGN